MKTPIKHEKITIEIITNIGHTKRGLMEIGCILDMMKI
jgi:hypothetical protein